MSDALARARRFTLDLEKHRRRETVRAPMNYRISGQRDWLAKSGRLLGLSAVIARLYILAICFTGAFRFVAVERLEPNRRFALVLKFAILAAGGAAIGSQLLP